MTRDELMRGLEGAVEEARHRAAGAVGAPIVLTIEGMGYRIVPEWVLESLVKVLGGAPDAPPKRSNG